VFLSPLSQRHTRSAILLVLVVGGVAYAQSQPPTPTPTPRESSRPPQSKPKSTQHKAAADQRGTEQSPIVVKILPTPKTKEESDQEAKDHQEKSSADWWLVRFNGLLVLVVFLQWIWMVRQEKWMRRNVEIAKDTAQAALRNATALEHSERSYVKISHAPPGLRIDPPPFSSSMIHHFAVNIEVKNIGNTPAIITDVIFDHKILPMTELLPIPEYPPHQPGEEALNLFLYKDDPFYRWSMIGVSQENIVSIQNGTKVFYLYGYIDYKDQFRNRYRAGYGRFYLPRADDLSNYTSPDDFLKRSNLFFITQPGYNYDRLRNQGEGTDWNEEPN